MSATVEIKVTELDGLLAEVRTLKQQRDKLLFALRYIEEQTHLGHIHDTASAAIARATTKRRAG